MMPIPLNFQLPFIICPRERLLILVATVRELIQYIALILGQLPLLRKTECMSKLGILPEDIWVLLWHHLPLPPLTLQPNGSFGTITIVFLGGMRSGILRIPGQPAALLLISGMA